MQKLKENLEPDKCSQDSKKKPSFKPKQGKRNKRQFKRNDTDHKYNDPSWYAKNDQMLKDAASFSYNAPLGNVIPTPYDSVTPAHGNASTIPGLMSLEILPCPSTSTTANSPANLAANNIYAYTRYMNSGAKNYDQADQMLYMLALDSLYYTFNWAKRVYGYSNQNYSQQNRYIPIAYAQADRVNFSSIITNLADYRYNLNRIAAQITSFCVPGVMPFFIRHSWMFSNIYKDSANAKAQEYMFVPAGYYVYNETDSQYGGQLIFKSFKDNMLYSDIIAALDEMLNAVAYSEDIGVMSGDILKAYGNERLFKLAAIPEDYRVESVYNEEVLNQIHNSNIVPIAYQHGTTVTEVEDLSITQDPNTGFIVWNPTKSTTLGVMSTVYNRSNYIVNMPWDNVTPANTMVGTRLLSSYDVSGTNRVNITILACGTEVVVARRIIQLTNTGTLRSTNIYQDTEYIDPTSVTNTAIDIAYLSNVSNFDWHPLVPILYKTSTDVEFMGYLGDISNYTLLQRYDLTNLHLTAVMSEFNIPQLGSF